MITDGPWSTSAPHPDTGACTITNAQGRVIAAMVPNADDAEFICRAREDLRDMDTTVHVDWKAFGQAVQAARKKLRYSQDELATATAISRNYIGMIERGKATDPSYVIVLTLCTWLELEMPR